MPKKIEAFIKPFKLDDVRKALEDAKLSQMTVIEAKGFGTQKGYSGPNGNSALEYIADFLPRMKIEIVVDDKDKDKAVAAIREAAATGRSGDGIILVSHVNGAVSIRTGQPTLPSPAP